MSSHVGLARSPHSCLEAMAAQPPKGRGSMPRGQVGHLTAKGTQVGPGQEDGEDLEGGSGLCPGDTSKVSGGGASGRWS